MSELDPRPIPIPSTQLRETQIYSLTSIPRPRLGRPADLDQLGLESPPTMIESPNPIGDIHMTGISPTLRPQPHHREPGRIHLEKREGQNMASASGEEPLIGTTPRKLLISPLQGGPPKLRARNIHRPTIF